MLAELILGPGVGLLVVMGIQGLGTENTRRCILFSLECQEISVGVKECGIWSVGLADQAGRGF